MVYAFGHEHEIRKTLQLLTAMQLHRRLLVKKLRFGDRIKFVSLSFIDRHTHNVRGYGRESHERVRNNPGSKLLKFNFHKTSRRVIAGLGFYGICVYVFKINAKTAKYDTYSRLQCIKK